VLRKWIVASHHLTGAIAQNEQSVRILEHQLFIQPASNPVSPRAFSCFGGMRCVRASHVGGPPAFMSAQSIHLDVLPALSFATPTQINQQCDL
jgi:hypothetical protein